MLRVTALVYCTAAGPREAPSDRGENLANLLQGREAGSSVVSLVYW